MWTLLMASWVSFNVNMYQSLLLSWPAYLWYTYGWLLPSYSVPRYLSYQSTTSLFPSGFRDGTSRKTVLSRISLTSSPSSDASLWASSMLIWLPPISVLWMLHVISMIVLPVSMSRAASSSPRPSGSLSLSWIAFSSSIFAWFFSDVMVARMNGLPSVVSPRSWTTTLGEALPSFVKYSTISGQSAIFLSAPTLNPRNSSGD